MTLLLSKLVGVRVVAMMIGVGTGAAAAGTSAGIGVVIAGVGAAVVGVGAAAVGVGAVVARLTMLEPTLLGLGLAASGVGVALLLGATSEGAVGELLVLEAI